MKADLRESKAKIRIGILDDHVLVRQALQMVLQKLGFVCVAEAGNGDDFLTACLAAKPELVISDLNLAGSSAVKAIKDLRASIPEVKILVSSAVENQRLFDEAIEAGADGYVHKASNLDILETAIETVLNGASFLGFLPAGAILLPDAGLAPREVDVLKLIAVGLSTKQVADRLTISVRTADHYRTRLMQKLRVHDAVSLTRYALRAGYVTLN